MAGDPERFDGAPKSSLEETKKPRKLVKDEDREMGHQVVNITRGTRRRMSNFPLVLLSRYLRKCHESKYLIIIAPLGRYLEWREADIHVVGLTHQTSPFDVNHDDLVDIIIFTASHGSSALLVTLITTQESISCSYHRNSAEICHAILIPS